MILRAAKINIKILLLLTFFSCQSQQVNNQRSLSSDDVATKNHFEINQFENTKKHKRLVDYTPYKYEVLFTNPECGVYKYKTPIESIGGKTLHQKPENVFCKNKYDQRRSGQRKQSPQFRLIEWIKDQNTKEIFFTYLSFRNKAVKEALCEVAKKGVKIRFVISQSERPEDYIIGNELLACSPENVEMKIRGFEGGLKYAHNKFLIINPRSKDEFKIVFSSGNMTSGPVIHHENWNFITTHPASYFAQSHLCAASAEWDDNSGKSRPEYIKAIKNCRAEIRAEEESDIKVFFIPGEGVKEDKAGKKTATEYLVEGDGQHPGISNAKKIWLACHRFFYSTMINALDRAISFKKKPDTKAELRIVADDDTYYVANDPAFDKVEVQKAEYDKMNRLQAKGAKIKFMETNHDEGQIHHSKFLIFADKNKNSKDPVDDFTALFTGSANLTGAGFKDNWENSYYITIPEVVKAFATQYVYTWDKLATEAKDLPKSAMIVDHLIDEPIIKSSEQEELQNK